MATVHHRRVVTVPTPTWYLERRGFSQQKLRNARSMPYSLMPYSLAVYSAAALPRAKSLRRGDSETSLLVRFAKPQVDYSEVNHLQPRIGCCWLAEWDSTPLGRKSGIPILSCWSQPAEKWEGSLSREALQKLHASHEWVPTMKNCQPLPREQKPDPLFSLETRFYWFADSLEKH